MNFSSEEFKMELRQVLIEENKAKKVNNIQLAIRCPLCGDSKKDKSKKRFYIKIDLYNHDEPVMFYCFNCWESGILNPSILRQMDIYDLDIVTGLRAYNKKVARKNPGYNFNIVKAEFTIPEVDEESKLNLYKKAYLEERLGRSFTFDELYKLKVVFNLGEFLIHNKIQKVSCDKDKALVLDKNYVGFLSINNDLINFRKVIDTNDSKRDFKRYEKYIIDETKLNRLKFYTIPTEVDTMSEEPITINIAEGTIDIWGVYFNVHNGGLPHSIYAAVSGADYRAVIEYFIREGIVGDDVTVNIFRDADQDTELYTRLKKEYGIWFGKFQVFSNTLSKDFGVPADQIELIKNKI